LLARPAPAHSWFAPRPGDHTPLVFAHQGVENLRPWTINEAEDLSRIMALGVDGINTDNPDRLLGTLK